MVVSCEETGSYVPRFQLFYSFENDLGPNSWRPLCLGNRGCHWSVVGAPCWRVRLLQERSPPTRSTKTGIVIMRESWDRPCGIVRRLALLRVALDLRIARVLQQGDLLLEGGEGYGGFFSLLRIQHLHVGGASLVRGGGASALEGRMCLVCQNQFDCRVSVLPQQFHVGRRQQLRQTQILAPTHRPPAAPPNPNPRSNPPPASTTPLIRQCVPPDSTIRGNSPVRGDRAVQLQQLRQTSLLPAKCPSSNHASS